jgi:hypothetical protein
MKHTARRVLAVVLLAVLAATIEGRALAQVRQPPTSTMFPRSRARRSRSPCALSAT